MSIYYKYDEQGYYLGETDDDTLDNITNKKPTIKVGFIPKWDGKKWTQVENHKGTVGYLNGNYLEIQDYGPLPSGFDTKLAEPYEAAMKRAKALLKIKRKEMEYGGFLFNGVKWDSGEKDELRLNSALKIFELSGVKEIPGFEPAEGFIVTLTPELAAGAATFLMFHYNKVFEIQRTKLAELSKLTNPIKINKWIENDLHQGWD